jgi:hypothetical protein
VAASVVLDSTSKPAAGKLRSETGSASFAASEAANGGRAAAADHALASNAAVRQPCG